MPADLTADCPTCACPAQPVGLACGFCGTPIPTPDDMVNADGTTRVEVVTGFRGWQVSYTADRRVRLESPTVPHTWEPGVWQVAECHRPNGRHAPDHPEYHGSLAADRKQWSPVKGCGGGGHGCGFYAARTREHLLSTLPEYVRYTEDNPTVIGRVQMAGKIIFASNGYRAQRVLPLVIYVPPDLWRLGADLKAEYAPHGVEVKMEATIILPKRGEGAIKWCAKCKGSMGKARTATCPTCGHTHK